MGPIVATLPVPTLVTPLNAPSPSHNRPPPPTRKPALHEQSLKHAGQPPSGSSQSVPVPPPSVSDPAPIHFHNAPPSPRHPAFDIPPDGWIPYASGNDSSTILVPPPHELSRPVSPSEEPRRSPSGADAALPDGLPTAPQGSRPGSRMDYTNPIQSRDYAHDGAPPKPPSIVVSSPRSRSRQSTLDNYDLLGPPRHEQVYRQGVDRESIMAGQGPSDTPPGVYRMHTVDDANEHGTLDRLFSHRYRSRRSPGNGKGRDEVPDINVESPVRVSL